MKSSRTVEIKAKDLFDVLILYQDDLEEHFKKSTREITYYDLLEFIEDKVNKDYTFSIKVFE